MRRIRLRFANLHVEFVDRDHAIERVVEWAERGTYSVKIVFGPEGCGKTAWLRQTVEILKGFGYDVVYVNPVEEEFVAEVGIQDLRKEFLNLVQEALMQNSLGRVVWSLIDFVKRVIKAGSSRLAVIVDDVFHVIGFDKAAIYVKGLLGVLEHPPSMYEKVVAVVTTSEGMSRKEIGRHTWSELMPIWNMSREGFQQLYTQIPGDKPLFEYVWRQIGGNPRILAMLYENRWDAEKVIEDLIKSKELDKEFIVKWGRHLEEAVEDPDYLWDKGSKDLVNELTARNLIVYNMYDRDTRFWIDQPPPEKDADLGIGRYVAWQTPLHREAVKRAILKWGKIS